MRPDRAIRAGTFNIRYENDADGPDAWRHRRAMVAKVLAEGDFWGLQEALPSQVEAIRADRPEFGVLSRTRDADPARGEACPILYRRDRWTLDAEDSGTFWLSPTPEEPGSQGWDAALPRIATFARFTASDGGAVYVYNAHLDHRGATARAESARLLVARIATRKRPDPVILLGDFNCGPASEPLRLLLSDARIDLVDAWRTANPAVAETPTFNGFRERCEGERIDFILVSRALAPLESAIDHAKPGGRWPSDHAPVSARLGFRATVPSGTAGSPDPAR